MFPLVLFLILATTVLNSAEAQDSTPDAAASVRFSANVDLVTLPITVRDAKGAPVSDLHREDFEVYENGVRQPIRIFRHEDIPVTVGLVIDHSGSMRPKMTEVIAAARTFVKSSNSEDEMFVVTFNERVYPGFAAGVHFTNRFDQLESIIRKAPLGGQTAFYDAVFEALEQVGLGSREKKALIVISDGGDNASARTLAEVLKLAGRSTAVIYTIGIFDSDDPDRNPDILRRLAHATGGEAYFPALPDGIIATCEGIARDMRSQYLVGYVPSPAAQHAGYRTIRVTAHAAARGKLSVRTRSGYFAIGGSGHLKDQASQ